MRQGNWKS